MLSQIKRLFGALRSGNKAAYVAILILIIGSPVRIIDTLIYSLITQLFVRQKKKIPNCYLIVSPPRSGSTLIYQVLTRSLDCLYLSNLHQLIPCHASYVLNWLSSDSRKLTRSYYGYTESLLDVNEGNNFINKIFENGDDPLVIREKFLRLLKRIDTRGKTIILKNVQVFDKIHLLQKAVPELKYVRIKREPLQIIQSTLRAYYELGTFHPVTSSMKSHNLPVSMAVNQYCDIEKELDLQLSTIAPSSIYTIRYEQFCKDPKSVISDEFWGNASRDYRFIPSLTLSKNQKISDQDLSEIKRALKDRT
jgi:hypothetical protein